MFQIPQRGALYDLRGAHTPTALSVMLVRSMQGGQQKQARSVDQDLSVESVETMLKYIYSQKFGHTFSFN